MSTDRLERAVENAAVPQQGHLGQFGAGSDFEEYYLHCLDCVLCVTATGSQENAERYAERHIEKKPFCESVAVIDGETGQRVAVVEEGRDER